MLSIRALVLLLLLAGLSSPTHACSCAGSLPPLKEKAETAAIFTGRVIKIVKTGAHPQHPELFTDYDVTFRVGQVIKGKMLKSGSGSTVNVRTGAGGGDCGYPFEQAEEYLVYAYQYNETLGTGICSRTTLLKGAENEVLELQGKLPALKTPPHPPQIRLLGKIDDAGYHGYVFQLINYLHDRIFYGPIRAQAFRDGAWHDIASTSFDDARKMPAPAPDAAAKSLVAERESLRERETASKLRGLNYLGRMSARSEFAPFQTKGDPWRIGFVYETEPAIDSGKKLSKSTKIVWGPRMEPNTPAKKLTFNEAFQGTDMLPDPLGTKTDE